MPDRPHTIEVLLTRIIKTPEGCWYYSRVPAPGAKQNYVQVEIAGRRHQAHRVVYERLKGPIPQGLVLDHLCLHRACCRPDHLDPVTNQENIRRGYALKPKKPKRTRPPRPRYVRLLLAICRRGHEYSEANTVYRGRKKKFRICRQCERIRYEQYKRRRLYGLPTPRRKLNAEQCAQLRAGYPMGGSYKAWGNRFGVSPSTIRNELLRED